ncbi:hypothetical protein MOQ_002268 [Trypanosoma cruzi marinkellei]|uniref:Uncharacterized protein n=1 Tax=Trypanosoma cruzi marinkellei TaxID=85056 RepID=K2NGB5_TRYCR|nr:hypothetical protein MOQ_002268 [Trypanosoma cruzi marinkellei]
MLHGANEEMGARPSNSYPLLNPKLVTHREEILGASESGPLPAPSPATPSLKKTANPAQKPSGKKTSTHVVSAQKMERSSSRNVSVGSASHANLLRPNSLARPYGHTHSVVKDSTDKIIPPDARRERPKKMERGRSLGSSSLRFSSSIPMRGFNGFHGGTGRTIPRRSMSHGRQESGRSTSGKLMGSPSPPRISSAREANKFPTPSSARRRKSTDSGKSGIFCRSKNSENTYVLQVVEKLGNARVAYDHVPRCAQEIPARYRQQLSQPPPPLTSDNSPSLRSSDLRRRSSPCRTRSNTPTVMKSGVPRHSPSNGGESRNQVIRNEHGGVDTQRASEVLNRNSSLIRAASPPGSRDVLAQGKKTNSVGAMSLPSQNKGRNLVPKTKEKAKQRKSVIGIERMLLFDTEPPRLFA